MLFNSFLNMQCTVVADSFVLSGQKKWDSKDLINKLFRTEWGRNILTGKTINEFTCEGYMYEGWERELGYKEGYVYPEKVLWYAGYLYRYLGETCELKEIKKKAKIDTLYKRYGFYHTQDWDYVKNDLWL